VDRLTRKELKTDQFAAEVSHGFDFVTQHTADFKKYGAIVLVVALLGGGAYFYRQRQAAARGEALSQALRIAGAKVGPPAPPSITFPTQDAKDTARAKALADVAAQYRGSNEGAIAGLYLGVGLADKGDLKGAEKQFQDVVDSAPADMASVATMALAQTLDADGKGADAEKLLKNLSEHPTALVSKEQALLELGSMVGKRNKAEGEKILSGLSNSRAAVAQSVVSALGALTNN